MTNSSSTKNAAVILGATPNSIIADSATTDIPMAEDKRRELAQVKADEVRAKKVVKREKRKASKTKKS